ncbi:hypothetical protein Kpol_147p3 [Vanderwaltozyma polyspora DSM 70294]|uniref:protein-tyrosine-phosphatase n=1 Tax=Vanderwaltozyma polyspora (strain ATCC 22028 / DSM 70294 / BCRC 21397 / CBS 2163 / NBRC 10782 / NRRL Y-8283 / UCD 57-17) TaxID=436907 RepID=A7TTT9_VANPO|nr:uncharacterized protein Kpol_147p3 [Vanderwaltozyma polyspora DSM 70294]EDO14320.1 hypothetical protein Kpol_147p3 [Vanderwaltozyma polyspora DSM 70294]
MFHFQNIIDLFQIFQFFFSISFINSPTFFKNPLSFSSPNTNINTNSSIYNSNNINSNSTNNSNTKQNDLKFLKPNGTSIITGVELGKLLDSTNNNNLLLIDLRTVVDFSKSHIKDSINVCLPSTLLRRRNFTFNKLLDNLSLSIKDLILKKFQISNSNQLRIIIYDNNLIQNDNNIPFTCYGISLKLLDYLSTLENSNNITISILSSGFNQFSVLFPCLIENNINTIDLNRLQNDDNDIHDLKLNLPEENSKKLSSSSLSSSSFINSVTPPCSNSPNSPSSPISALLRFQLPSYQNTPKLRFKIPRNEEIMNLESYLSAVNISERQHLENKSINSFVFPASNANNASQSSNSNTDKLKFQKKFDQLYLQYDEDEINSVIPNWFRNLMKRTKVDFIMQFQKLDLLERKRLNNCLSHKTSHSIDANVTSTLLKPPNMDCNLNLVGNPAINALKLQKRSMSQPNFELSSNSKPFSPLKLRDDDDDDQSIEISSGLELGSKNRYKDIFPYEHSRVILRKHSLGTITDINSNLSDISENYINANYLKLPEIPIPNSENSDISLKKIDNIPSLSDIRYIATQAPMLSTVYDFYTCVMNNNVPLILSLTDRFENGIEKCFQYWNSDKYNDIEVKLLEEIELSELIYSKDDCSSGTEKSKSLSNIIIRRIQLQYYIDGKLNTYDTLQLQLINWPDLGTMLDPTELIVMTSIKNIVMNKLLEEQKYASGEVPTILVHCSAGCGRTGTWCTVDAVLSNLNIFEKLQRYINETTSKDYDVFDPIVWTINVFRKQRISMVQTINQYLFVYECLLFYFTSRLHEKYKIKDNYTPNNMHNKSMEFFMEQIQDLEVIDRFVDEKAREPMCSFA